MAGRNEAHEGRVESTMRAVAQAQSELASLLFEVPLDGALATAVRRTTQELGGIWDELFDVQDAMLKGQYHLHEQGA